MRVNFLWPDSPTAKGLSLSVEKMHRPLRGLSLSWWKMLLKILYFHDDTHLLAPPRSNVDIVLQN